MYEIKTLTEDSSMFDESSSRGRRREKGTGWKRRKNETKNSFLTGSEGCSLNCSLV